MKKLLIILLALIKGMEPADLTQRLESLAEKFNKEIFKPTQMIKSRKNEILNARNYYCSFSWFHIFLIS
jgi:hypothetical protein